MSTNTPILQDAVLIEFLLKDATSSVGDGVAHIAAELGMPADSKQSVQALEEPRVTIYLRGLKLNANLAAVGFVVRKNLDALAAGDIEISRLAAIKVLPGASAGEAAGYHYVVRTDVTPGCEEDLEHWYDQEHLAGLASVPGVVLAQRLVSLDAAPRYYACYDLTAPNILQTPQWLAVRETPWSGRVRPTFRNTRRITSRLLPI